MKIFLNYYTQIIKKLESDNFKLSNALFIFISATTLRNILEIFSVFLFVKNNQFPLYRGNVETLLPAVNIHYYISYLALALAITLIFYLLTKNNPVKIFKTICPFFYILIAAQMIDIIISGGSNLSYLTPEYHGNLILRYFTFFGEWKTFGGVTYGMKIEITFILIFSFCYIYIKSPKFKYLKSFAVVLILYNILFLYGITPFIIKYIGLKINPEFYKSNYSYIIYFTFLTIIETALLTKIYFNQKQRFSTTFKIIQNKKVKNYD